MKWRLIFLFFVSVVTASLFQGCYKTSEPQACFTLESDTFTLFDLIHIKNCSQNAEYFYVDYGDSTEPHSFVDYDGISEHHYYRKNGDYVITFYAYDKNLTKRSVAAKKIYIRSRYLKSVEIKKISWNIDQGIPPWDSTDGPDIYLAYKDSNYNNVRITPIWYNLKISELPIILPCTTPLKTGMYRFMLMDDDAPSEPQMMYISLDMDLGRDSALQLNFHNQYEFILKTPFIK